MRHYYVDFSGELCQLIEPLCSMATCLLTHINANICNVSYLLFWKIKKEKNVNRKYYILNSLRWIQKYVSISNQKKKKKGAFINEVNYENRYTKMMKNLKKKRSRTGVFLMMHTKGHDMRC